MGCTCSRPPCGVRNVRQRLDCSCAPVAVGKPNVRGHYRVGKLLGSGAFGQVRECMERETKTLLAMKIMEKKSHEKGHWSNESMLLREVAVLAMLDHPCVIKYFDLYEDDKYLYAIIEKCRGGELFDTILEQGTIPEKRSSFLIYQMLNAVAYIHSQGVVHRDIKAENFLFLDDYQTATPVSDDGETIDYNLPPAIGLKLIDFGMSAQISKNETLTDVCGSPHYLAPELIRRKYSFKADVWALGILAYLMLYGKYPFDGPSTNAIVDMILTNKVSWEHSQGKPPVSPQAIQFLRYLLRRSPERRPSAQAALEHEWFADARRYYQRVAPTLPRLSTQPGPLTPTTASTVASTSSNKSNADQYAEYRPLSNGSNADHSPLALVPLQYQSGNKETNTDFIVFSTEELRYSQRFAHQRSLVC